MTAGAGFELTGNEIQGGDAFISVTGNATAARTGNAWSIDGSISGPPYPLHLAFVMQRPDSGTPSAFGGAWTFVLERVGTMPLALDVPADGGASTAPTMLGGTPGGTRYTLPAGQCAVSPGSAPHCELRVDSPPEVRRLYLHGMFDAAGSGHGTFFLASPPSIVDEGSWSATRP